MNFAVLRYCVTIVFLLLPLASGGQVLRLYEEPHPNADAQLIASVCIRSAPQESAPLLALIALDAAERDTDDNDEDSAPLVTLDSQQISIAQDGLDSYIVLYSLLPQTLNFDALCILRL